jgi:segregation and condensation protein B
MPDDDILDEDLEAETALGIGEDEVVPIVDGELETADDLDDVIGAPSLGAAIEALLLVSDEPMSVVDLAAATHRTVDDVDATVRGLADEYVAQGRGFELREVAGGWRFYTALACAPVVERFVTEGQQARMTQAALETLAVIAYRQPITRGRISAVRGVNVDSVVRTLLTRGLIEEAGLEPESGAHLYRTTAFFLERLGLASLDDLPPLAEHIPDLADLEDVLDAVATGE